MTDSFLNPLNTRLAEGRVSLCPWLSSGSPVNAEAMASMGFHWLCVDLEHGSADISQVEAVFVAAERHGAAPMVRIGSLDGHLARRLLDLGADEFVHLDLDVATRRVIADVVRDGGFPQPMLGPIDFVQLYKMFGPEDQFGGAKKAAVKATEATDA